MKDRPEFLDRLKADLGAGLAGFRSGRRRRRIVGSAVGGLALLAGVGVVVASGGEGPRDSVSAVGDVPEPPEEDAPADGPVQRGEVATGTVRDLTDTVGDLVDRALRPGTPLGGPFNLVANDSAPGGAVQACPARATTQEGSVFFEGELQELNESDDVVRFVSEHIRNTYPPGTPIRTSVVYEAATSVRGRTRVVLAPWVGEDEVLVGAWFSVSKINATLAIGSDWGCTPFQWGYGEDTGSVASTRDTTTLSISEVDELIGGLRTGPIDYRVGQTPAELRSFVDIAVRGTVVAVHEGRTFRSLLEPSGLNDEPFATLEIEGEEFAATGSVRDGSTFYIEIQTGDLRHDQLQVLVGTEVMAFAIDTSDVDLGEQWAIDNPLGGRPDASEPIFTTHPQGLLLVTEQSLVSVYDELPVGWSPAQNFTTGTEAADWVVTEAEK